MDARSADAAPQKAADRYRFGEFTLDSRRACLTRAGAEIALRPKSFSMLQYLVVHAGRAVGKDELLSAIWPQVVVTEDSLTHCISEIRSALGDVEQKMVKTVTRRGYLFTPTVLVHGGSAPAPEILALLPQADVPTTRASAPTLKLRWLTLSGAVLLGFALVAWLGRDRGPDAPRLSLVVLPFANLGGDPSQSYLADVVSDDLTTALSRLRGAMVIAPGSSFALKGSPSDLAQLGMRLGVRYAVQGGVLPSEDRLRISARLIETGNAATLWSDQFDVPRADLAQAQSIIATRLATALDAELVSADSRRSVRSGTSVDAEDLAMQCDAAWFRLGAQAAAPSYERCEQALQIDALNVRALVRLASFHANRVSRVQSPDPPADLARANALVARALAVDPNDYAAHCARAVTLEGEHRVHEAIAAGERCLALNRSNAAAYRILAANHFFLAQPEKTLEFVELGMRISPLDIQMQTFLLFGGWAHFMMGHDDEALAWLRRAAAVSPESPPIRAGLTSVLALTGHKVEARAELHRYLALKGTRTRTIAQWNHMPDDNATFRRFDARFKSGLRLAGMAER